MGNDVDCSERFLGPGEAGLELARIGSVVLEDDAGRAELGVVLGARVVNDRDAADRSRDRDCEEGQHQDLLSPLAAEQAERPADQGAARGAAAALGSGQRGRMCDGTQRRSPAASSDSGPGGAIVWSTT